MSTKSEHNMSTNSYEMWFIVYNGNVFYVTLLYLAQLGRSKNTKYTPTMGILDSARCFGSLMILIENLALNAGSSKQGKAIRAAVGSNCVAASTLELRKRIHDIYALLVVQYIVVQ